MAAWAERKCPGFQGLCRESKAAETYLGSCGLLVVVLTASGEAKLLRERSLASSAMIFFGSARTGIG
jgi:hypothetical protein